MIARVSLAGIIDPAPGAFAGKSRTPYGVHISVAILDNLHQLLAIVLLHYIGVCGYSGGYCCLITTL